MGHQPDGEDGTFCIFSAKLLLIQVVFPTFTLCKLTPWGTQRFIRDSMKFGLEMSLNSPLNMSRLSHTVSLSKLGFLAKENFHNNLIMICITFMYLKLIESILSLIAI